MNEVTAQKSYIKFIRSENQKKITHSHRMQNIHTHILQP